MPIPIILSTWSFGLIANRAGWPALSKPNGALDAVEQAAIAVERDPKVDSVGIGGSPDASGRVSLDACVMLSPKLSAGVACIRRFAHPVSIARRVMEKTPHKLLVGTDADAFAEANGFKQENLLTDAAAKRWQAWMAARSEKDREKIKQEIRRPNREENYRNEEKPSHDTVGILAIDSTGAMAGACSTSGLPFKLPGRVGDSPILGHGLYVDPRAGAAVTTGDGELMAGICASYLAVERMRSGDSPLAAIKAVLERLVSSYTLNESAQCGLILLRPGGEWACGSLRPGFKTALTTADGEKLLDPQYVMLGK